MLFPEDIVLKKHKYLVFFYAHIYKLFVKHLSVDVFNIEVLIISGKKIFRGCYSFCYL